MVKTDKADLDFVELNNSYCRIYSLTGGKASNLAKIIAKTKKGKNEKIFVPYGVVVTTSFYEKVFNQNENLKNLIAKLGSKKYVL